ncbi:MAG TPA: hypothetical protein VNS79_09495 [Sphingobium sp.]|nr:hypothetical protein [Sphingobium sp.]
MIIVKSRKVAAESGGFFVAPGSGRPFCNNPSPFTGLAAKALRNSCRPVAGIHAISVATYEGS